MSAEPRLEPCRSALNRVAGMSFKWSLNPYMGCAHRCTYCYVRAFEKRADRPSDDRYGQSVRVKTNVVEVLRQELSRASWTREHVVIGAATDPYQPVEGRFRLSRSCIAVLTERSTPFSIITRGPLVVRDRDVLQEAARRMKVSVNVSVPTLDDAIWRATEPGTRHPRQRLRAVRMLAEAGVQVNVALAPIIPGLSDRPEHMLEVVRAARAAGAAQLWTTLLFLRPGIREHFLETLAQVWPGEAERLAAMYAKQDYLPKRVMREHSEVVKGLDRDVPRARDLPPLIEPEPPRFAEQLGLGLDWPGSRPAA